MNIGVPFIVIRYPSGVTKVIKKSEVHLSYKELLQLFQTLALEGLCTVQATWWKAYVNVFPGNTAALDSRFAELLQELYNAKLVAILRTLGIPQAQLEVTAESV